jgi:hypothetical protein
MNRDGRGGQCVRPADLCNTVDPVPLLGDVVTARSVGLERHGRVQGSWEGPLPYATRLLSATRSDPCNKAA